MVIFLIIAQIFAVIVSTYLLLLERKYCKHLDWWWDAGAWIFFIVDLIPFIGLLTSIVGCVDYVKNIEKQLNSEINEANEKLRKHSSDYTTVKELYQSHCKMVKTLSANCISRNRGCSESDSEIMAKDCLCNELAKQLLPYINYEKYVIVDEYNDEIKHVATIKIVDERS